MCTYKLFRSCTCLATGAALFGLCSRQAFVRQMLSRSVLQPCRQAQRGGDGRVPRNFARSSLRHRWGRPRDLRSSAFLCRRRVPLGNGIELVPFGVVEAVTSPRSAKLQRFQIVRPLLCEPLFGLARSASPDVVSFSLGKDRASLPRPTECAPAF